MTKTLSIYFKLHGRYSRSVNLERDLDDLDALQGYIPTERSADALRRIASSLCNPKAHRAWTMTGVYGTGKSAFAHYLACLCSPRNSPIRQAAQTIAAQSFGAESPELAAIEKLTDRGLFRAVATGQREPLSWTIARALANGAETFWQGKRKPEWISDLIDWRIESEKGSIQITPQQILATLKDVLEVAKADVLFIIDELGKNLEFAAQHQGTEDLYLLQQVTELRSKGEHRVYFLGLLHQSFAGYCGRLAAIEQSEWSKIQGRFEDIPFTESPSQMTRLIGQAIDRTKADPLLLVIHQQSEAWFTVLQTLSESEAKSFAAAYPLHPLVAVVLPMLCVRYAQNDRSLFTFLTSDEPYAFSQFLKSNIVSGDQIPTLKLHQIYDYFVESVTGLASRINLQRWLEVQSLIQDARGRSPDVLKVLKTIGVLNLVTSTGALRSTPELVTLALCDVPNSAEQKHWQQVIQDLQEKGVITYRKQLDELRIWEGSDFDVEGAIYEQLEKERRPVAELLAASPLKPLVAQRHYTNTGTLRYFEQRYIDSRDRLSELRCSVSSHDGLIAYWMEVDSPENIPEQTADGKPLIIVSAAKLDLLRVRAQEFQALKTIRTNAPELLGDGVAQKEVKHRSVEAERLLGETLSQSFDWSEGQNLCWVEGNSISIRQSRAFQAMLSDVSDRTYSQGLILDNELINRRDLTTQGAKARRELIEAMLERGHQVRLGLQGYGPEVTIYESVLRVTGIHRSEQGSWGLYPPQAGAGVATVWEAIVQFCFEAKDKPQSLDRLYQRLESPPYGVKQGVIPVLLAAVLLYYLDEISVYKDGTFVPVLGAEHFELLVKDPARFSVKYIEVAGVRSQVFRELEAILRSSPAKSSSGSRNRTVLSIVKPLVQFVRKLPAYTAKTRRISAEAQDVIQALLKTQEPDALLFVDLPQACGFEPLDGNQGEEAEVSYGFAEAKLYARRFRETLVQRLREIHNAYDTLLTECETLLYNAFGLRSSRDQLRQDLQFRSKYLLGSCLESSLDRFVRAAADETAEGRAWLEALLMIVADKPAEVWTDTDAIGFELRLSELSRRFKNLEALQKEVAASNHGGFDVRRLTVTRPNGEEVNRMVWMSHEQQKQIAAIGQEVLKMCDDPQLQQGILTWLAEQILGEPDANATLEPVEKNARSNKQVEL